MEVPVRLLLPTVTACCTLFLFAGASSAQTTTQCQTFGNRTQCSTTPDQTQQTNQGAATAGSLIGSLLRKKPKDPIPQPQTALQIDLSTGNGFLATCDKNAPGQNFWLCAGYVSGFLNRESLDKEHLICIPAAANNGQIMDVILAYMRDNPADRHQPSSALVYVALAKAFRCSR